MVQGRKTNLTTLRSIFSHQRQIGGHQDQFLGYIIFACTGILFNHESPLRPERFVTHEIVSAACQIAKGSSEKLQLGNISIARDWICRCNVAYASAGQS